jgi:WD40 repeat protein
VFPENGMGTISLEEVTAFENEYYKSNVWLMKCNSNGRYMCSPTTDGRVFVWNLRSREVAAILFDHTSNTFTYIVYSNTHL